MSRLVLAELLKLRTVRTGWVLCVSAVGLSLLGVVPTLALGTFRTPGDVTGLVATGSIGGLVILILGIVGAAGEHRHGTITPTVLVTPSRPHVVAAKAIAYAIAGMAITIGIDLAVAVVAVPWLGAKGAPAPDAGTAGRLLLGTVLYGALAGSLGVGVGAVLRNQVAGVVIVLLEMLAFEPILVGLAPEVGRYAPQASSIALLTGGATGTLTMWAGGLALLGYAALFVTAGMLLERERDIT
jgi:ABC-2 type transport system permease protein